MTVFEFASQCCVFSAFFSRLQPFLPLVEGETSSLECAHQLGKLCENRHLVVNLIPYNATDVKDKLQCPSEKHMQQFRDIVASYGSFCTIRRTMGADIASACGQLVTKVEEEEKRASRERAVDIEDIVPAKRDDKDGMSPNGSESSRRGGTKELDGRRGASPTRQNIDSRPAPSWLEAYSTEDLDKWEKILTIGSAIVASCFVVSSVLLFRKQSQR